MKSKQSFSAKKLYKMWKDLQPSGSELRVKVGGKWYFVDFDEKGEMGDGVGLVMTMSTNLFVGKRGVFDRVSDKGEVTSKNITAVQVMP